MSASEYKDRICIQVKESRLETVLASMTVFILKDALSVWTNLGKHSSFVCLFVSSVKTGIRRIIRRHELSSVVRRSSRAREDSSSSG